MNLCIDKELFSGTYVKENTMNLCIDKELFSGTYVNENTTFKYSHPNLFYYCNFKQL